MPKLPWLKWYPQDWRNDPKLRLCSIGARGMLAELMGLGHDSDEYGHVLVNGEPPQEPEELALLCAVSPQECTELVAELEHRGVVGRDTKGALYSRRMIREHNKRVSCSRAGRKGGGSPRFKDPPLNGSDKEVSESSLNTPLTSDFLASDLSKGGSGGSEEIATVQSEAHAMANRRNEIARNRPPHWNPEGWPMIPPCPKCRKPLRLRKNSKTGTLYYNHHPEVGMGCPFHCDAEELQVVVKSMADEIRRKRGEV